jgi:hypothetical protein
MVVWSLLILTKYISSLFGFNSAKEEHCYMGKKVNAEKLNSDRRIISRKLLSGEISEKDIQSLLKKLPDVGDNAEEVSLENNEK